MGTAADRNPGAKPVTPIFLPHTMLDAIGELTAHLLPSGAQKRRQQLRALRDRALDEGASVLLLVWPTLEWTLLAVDTPSDVAITDPAQLIPNLMANPDALAQMLAKSQKGEHLVWLQLTRSAPALH